MKYTFIRHDRDPRLTYLFSSYEESADTQPIQYNGEVVCGLVLSFDSARTVALIQGWKEITDELDQDKRNEDQPKETIKENKTKESATVIEVAVKPKAKPKRKRSTKSTKAKAKK